MSKDKLENNKLIAEFMGFSLNQFGEVDNSNIYLQWMSTNINCVYDIQHDDFPLLDRNDYWKFHSSWDWLMPVWNKILKFGKSEFGFQWEQSIGETFITINTGNHNKFKLSWLNSGEIKDVYYVIVEFIKWYNQNKLNETN